MTGTQKVGRKARQAEMGEAAYQERLQKHIAKVVAEAPPLPVKRVGAGLVEIPTTRLASAGMTARQIDVLVHHLAQIREAEPLADLTARMSMAREWAKIQADAEELRRRLLRLELHAFRRIGMLEVEREIFNRSTIKAAAARFLGKMTFAEVDELSNTWAEKTTAAAVVKAEKNQRESVADEWTGRRHAAEGFARPPQRTLAEEMLLAEVGIEPDPVRHVRTIGDAVRWIVDDYASRYGEFTVTQMADELLLDLDLDDAYRNGVRQVCREAVQRSSLTADGYDGSGMPLFIMCRSEKSVGGYTRIPFRTATLGQLDDMIEMREEQIRSDQENLDKMRALRDRIARMGVGVDDQIGTGLDTEQAAS